MKKPVSISKPDLLREKAEKLLDTSKSKTYAPLSTGDEKRLLHELEVHQVELIMQNEELKQANELSEISAQKYTELYDFAPVGYFSLSREGKILSLNLNGAKMLGKNRIDLKDKKFAVYVLPSSIQAYKLFLENIFESTSEQTCELQILTTINTPKYLFLSGSLNADRDQCFVTATDISLRKQSEEELRITNQFNQTLLQTLPFGINIVDESGNILYMNNWLNQLFAEDMLGNKCWNLYKDDKLQCVDCPLHNPIRLGETISNETQGVLGGKTFQITHTGMTYKGQKAVLETFTDITDLKQTESLLVTSENKYQVIFENVQDVFYQTTFSGTILEISPSILHFSDFNRDELIGSSIYDLYYNPDERAALLTQIIVSGELRDYEIRLKTKAGTFKYASINARLIYDADGKPDHIDGALRDISDRKLAENKFIKLNEELEQRVTDRTAQLLAANIELEKFSYTASHDLRTPLRALNGYASMLLEDYSDLLNADGVRMLHVIQDNANKMGYLIDDLLAFSKIGHTAPIISEINMFEMAESVYRELVEKKGNENIEFRLNEIPNAHGDPSLIRQVFTNLISNAIKYTSKKPQRVIEITHSKEESEIIYIVKDNGAGFNMAHFHKLFGVFQRLHTAREFEGNGIGLAIVQRIIESHKGRVWAEGEVGKGATFSFSLPVKTE
jgi:PAS domain S-box-containing protein